ncbi:MAG: PorT family protein [Sphingobacteriales bacterium JAD_PAG50586_3]|nr:MAG: PorT family protein [Sphingobacteriales bacterium JAD_PAG50586_3]
MKRALIIAIVAVVAIGVQAQAQRIDQPRPKDSRSRFHIGAKAGLNINNAYDVDTRNFKSAKKSGFMGGLFLNIPMGRFLGLQLEGLYSQKGTNGTGTINGVEYTLKRTTNNIDVPLMLQLKPFKFISIVAGPQFSYLLSQKDVYDDAGNTTVREQFTNQDIRKANIGVTAGADIYMLGLVFSGRVGTDLLKNSTNSSLAPNYKNIWGQLGVGFRF